MVQLVGGSQWLVDRKDDIDYFSFLAEEGEVYPADLTSNIDATVGFAIHNLHCTEIRRGTVGIRWTPSGTGEYFIMVVAASESGSYTLTVTHRPCRAVKRKRGAIKRLTALFLILASVAACDEETLPAPPASTSKPRVCGTWTPDR